MNARPETAADQTQVQALERRRVRYQFLLTVVGLVGLAVGSYLVLLSGYCPSGESCLAGGSVGAGFVAVGFVAVIGVGLVGSLLFALALSFLGVGAGALAGGTQGAGWVGMVIGGEFFAMGVILLAVQQWQARRRRLLAQEEARLWATGRPGRAVVIDVDDTGGRAGQQRLITLTLRIDPGNGGDRFTAEVEHRVDPDAIPQPGDLHQVRLDPADPTRIVVGPREGTAGAPS